MSSPRSGSMLTGVLAHQIREHAGYNPMRSIHHDANALLFALREAPTIQPIATALDAPFVDLVQSAWNVPRTRAQ